MGGNNTKQKDTKTEEEKVQEELDKEEPIDINVEWNCGECTYLNKSGTIECSVCSFKRVLVKRRRPLPPPNKEDIPEQTPEQKIALIEEKVMLIMKLQDIKDGKIKEEEETNEKEEEKEIKEDDKKEEEEKNENEEKNETKEDEKKEEENDNEEKEEEDDENDNEEKEEKNEKDEKEEEEEETIEQHKKRLKIVNELLLRQQLKLDEVSGPEIREKRKELTKIILKRMEENDKVIASLNNK